VEIFHKGVRVASHARSRAANKASTLDEHRPKAHQRYLQWTPSRLVEWGRKIGPLTAELLERVDAGIKRQHFRRFVFKENQPSARTQYATL
jgi:transposase